MSKKLGPASKKAENRPFYVVAIGASAGGLEAVSEFLKNLPENTGMGFVYVQHLDPTHESMLADILSRETKMKVQDAKHLLPIEPNNFYVIPANKSLAVVDGVLTLDSRQPKPAIHMPVDKFFTSLAENHKEASIGIVLSGNAHDGTLGLKAIKSAGGLTFAQDDSAGFKSMPKSAIAEGYVDLVMSPKEIAVELGRISKNAGIIRQNLDNSQAEQTKEEVIKAIVTLLKKSVGVDFAHYKTSTIKRRIIRRMLLHKLHSLEDYLNHLKRDSSEITVLFQDLLINVTSFFRDTDTIEYLRKTLLPRIVKDKSPNEPVRIWVPACSTGEEAYSLAIILAEILSEKGLSIPVQIFATDLSESAIAKARIGLYSKSDVVDVPPKILQRFFTKVDGSYRINKTVRDVCVFATHNVFSDPPFSKVDLISCCNLMIYLDTVLQNKVISTFHYALKNDGFLVLGKSETPGVSTALFSQIERKYKVYARKNDGANRVRLELSYRVPGNERTGASLDLQNDSTDPNFERTVEEILLKDYIPACVVVNQGMDILQLHGQVGTFLEVSAGKASLNLLKMVRSELIFDLRRTVHKAIRSNKVEKKSGIEVKYNNIISPTSVEVIPLGEQAGDRLFLIVFEKLQPSVVDKPGKATFSRDETIKKLRHELESTKEDMRSILEEHEASNEELQSANEEIVSSNEELQSINEELETSKEEVESSNEELMTINNELQVRNEQLAESYEYSEVISETIREAVLVLDKDFRVKSANKSFYRIFKVTEEETEGMLFYELGNRQWDILELRQLLEEIMANRGVINGFEVKHDFPSIGLKEMLIHARTIVQKVHQKQLIILAIEDITEHRQVQRAIEERERQFRNMADNSPVIIWTCARDKVRNFVNKTWFEFTGCDRKQVAPDWEAALHPDDLKRYVTAFDKSFDERSTFQFEYRLRRSDGEYRWMMDIAKPNFSPSQSFEGYIGTSTELHDKKILMEDLDSQVKKRTHDLAVANNELQRSNSELQQFAFVASHDLQEPLRKINTYIDRIQNGNENLTEISREYFEKIVQSSRRMTKLIDDLLDLSRISFSDQKFIKVDLNYILRDVLSGLDLIVSDKQAEIVHENNLPVIQAIPLQMTQLFHNLIANAIKFSREHTTPRIHISCRMLSRDEINERRNLDSLGQEYSEIIVSDNGIGFNPEFAEQIFVIFQRLNNNKKFPGTGIGLALCRRIVNNHNGEIFAESTKDGAAFHVILPLKQIDAAARE